MYLEDFYLILCTFARRWNPETHPASDVESAASSNAMTAPLSGDASSKHAVKPAESSPLLTETLLPLPELCAQIHARIESFLQERHVSPRVQGVQEQTRTSLGVIAEALDRYSLAELSLSYNGGKDCLVLLILYLSALFAKGLCGNTLQSIQSVYIQAPHPFREVEDFVATSVKTYSLALDEYAKPMKAAFADYLHDKPSVKAIFVGTRRTDPHGQNLTHFDPTDHGWPDFMRIHPVIDWHYADIWTFIRYLDIPYCILYDRGYTSLGGTTDTHPNPALLRQPSHSQLAAANGTSTPKFRPAYELIEDQEERLGRDS